MRSPLARAWSSLAVESQVTNVSLLCERPATLRLSSNASLPRHQRARDLSLRCGHLLYNYPFLRCLRGRRV